MNIPIECYAGYRGEETPRRFQLDGRWIEIVEIIDRWLGPQNRYFKVRGDDKRTYTLRHDTLAGRWEMEAFSSGAEEAKPSAC